MHLVGFSNSIRTYLKLEINPLEGTRSYNSKRSFKICNSNFIHRKAVYERKDKCKKKLKLLHKTY